jgi:NADPH:quinone reductase
MSAAIRVHKFGGPDVLSYDQIEIGMPGPGEVKLRQHAAGVNYIDVSIRLGAYTLTPKPPFVLGNEGAGEVTAVGPGVADLKVGDRVAYVASLGGYAGERLLDVERAVKIPDGIGYHQAAAIMLRGMTAEYLLHRVYKVRPGDAILVHAAAGGVGQILCQWARAIGATVIGTVGSKEKGKIAQANGCHQVIYYREEDFPTRVKEITKGELCAVVYDSVGKTTFPASLDCLRPMGMFASFGNASGHIENFDLNLLHKKGSLFATRPSLNTYAAKRADLLSIATNLFEAVAAGKIKVPIGQSFDLKDARKAHQALEDRATTGSTILVI